GPRRSAGRRIRDGDGAPWGAEARAARWGPGAAEAPTWAGAPRRGRCRRRRGPPRRSGSRFSFLALPEEEGAEEFAVGLFGRRARFEDRGDVVVGPGVPDRGGGPSGQRNHEERGGDGEAAPGRERQIDAERGGRSPVGAGRGEGGGHLG